MREIMVKIISMDGEEIELGCDADIQIRELKSFVASEVVEQVNSKLCFFKYQGGRMLVISDDNKLEQHCLGKQNLTLQMGCLKKIKLHYGPQLFEVQAIYKDKIKNLKQSIYQKYKVKVSQIKDMFNQQIRDNQEICKQQYFMNVDLNGKRGNPDKDVGVSNNQESFQRFKDLSSIEIPPLYQNSVNMDKSNKMEMDMKQMNKMDKITVKILLISTNELIKYQMNPKQTVAQMFLQLCKMKNWDKDQRIQAWYMDDKPFHKSSKPFEKLSLKNNTLEIKAKPDFIGGK